MSEDEDKAARERRLARERRARWRAKNPDYNKAYRDKHKDKLSEYHKAYYQTNHAELRQKQAIYNRKNSAKAAERAKIWTKNNPEKATQIRRKSYIKNKAKKLAYGKIWADRNPEKIQRKRRNWQQKNRAKCAAKNMVRYSRKKHATPAWIDLDAVAPFYAEAARLTTETGIRHEVDHIVPLQGKTVCGLHVHYNLRVITGKENRVKNNRWEPEWVNNLQFG